MQHTLIGKLFELTPLHECCKIKGVIENARYPHRLQAPFLHLHIMPCVVTPMALAKLAPYTIRCKHFENGLRIHFYCFRCKDLSKACKNENAWGECLGSL